MRTTINTLLGAVLCLLVTFGGTQSAAGQNRIVFDTPTTTGGSSKHPTVTVGQIYSMNTDGSEVVQLTSGSNAAGSPSWSPNQQYISFFGSGGLQVMEAIGQANRGRTFVVATDVQNTGSDWSPDGNLICFSGYSTRGLWIVSVNPATGEVGTPIQVAAGWCGYPSWSPDGNKIAYTFWPGGAWGNQYIKVLDLTTGAETPFDMVSSAHPEWSPDGTKIAFDATVTVVTTKGNKTTTSNYIEVFVANADGTAAAQVTNFKDITALPAWSPDGATLALTREISGTRSIHRMDLNTGSTTFLHDGEAADWNP